MNELSKIIKRGQRDIMIVVIEYIFEFYVKSQVMFRKDAHMSFATLPINL